jgi:hypothetical protein
MRVITNEVLGKTWKVRFQFNFEKLI